METTPSWNETAVDSVAVAGQTRSEPVLAALSPWQAFDLYTFPASRRGQKSHQKQQPS
jgi:hypothetical protein